MPRRRAAYRFCVFAIVKFTAKLFVCLALQLFAYACYVSGSARGFEQITLLEVILR